MNQQLEEICAEIRKDPKGEFAREAFVRVLAELPPAPGIPGLEVFCAWAVKGVPYFVDLAIIRDSRVFLTYRDDQHYKGWHFPGFFRLPRTSMLENCQTGAARELGPTFKITRIEHLFTFDQPTDPRFHLASDLQLVEFEGDVNPKDGLRGEWFSEMPADILPTHACYWPHIEKHLSA